jgi:hypothetical protein
MHLPTRLIRRRASLVVLVACALAVVVTAASAAAAGRHSHGKTLRLKAHVVTSTFVFTKADGTVGAPQAPAPGDWLETTEKVYRGDHRHHARTPFTTSHTICVFVAQGAPRCDSQVVLGHDLVLFHTPGGADDRTRVRGGTGRFAGVTGTITRHVLPDDTEDISLVLHTKR